MGMKYKGKYYTHEELVDASVTQTEVLNEQGICDEITITRDEYNTWTDKDLIRCIVGDSNKFGVPTFLTIYEA